MVWNLSQQLDYINKKQQKNLQFLEMENQKKKPDTSIQNLIFKELHQKMHEFFNFNLSSYRGDTGIRFPFLIQDKIETKIYLTQSCL
jgi:hypothetical protein